MGQYGYANQNYAYQNYGGHMPMTTPYGYSGANAYQGSSGNGMKIAIAGGAGLLAGIAANKLMHHWGGYSQEQLMNAPCSRGWGMLGHELIWQIWLRLAPYKYLSVIVCSVIMGIQHTLGIASPTALFLSSITSRI